MPFLLAEILNFQGSTHRYGVGSFSKLVQDSSRLVQENIYINNKNRLTFCSNQ